MPHMFTSYNTTTYVTEETQWIPPLGSEYQPSILEAENP